MIKPRANLAVSKLVSNLVRDLAECPTEFLDKISEVLKMIKDILQEKKK